MNDDESARVVRLGQRRPHDPDVRQLKDNHGPVHTSQTHENDLNQVLTFEGTDEADVLHAADAWKAEHPYVRGIATNWKGDLLYEIDEDVAGTPGFTSRHRFDHIVDRTVERDEHRRSGRT